MEDEIQNYITDAVNKILTDISDEPIEYPGISGTYNNMDVTGLKDSRAEGTYINTDYLGYDDVDIDFTCYFQTINNMFNFTAIPQTYNVQNFGTYDTIEVDFYYNYNIAPTITGTYNLTDTSTTSTTTYSLTPTTTYKTTVSNDYGNFTMTAENYIKGKFTCDVSYNYDQNLPIKTYTFPNVKTSVYLTNVIIKIETFIFDTVDYNITYGAIDYSESVDATVSKSHDTVGIFMEYLNQDLVSKINANAYYITG